MISRRQFCVSAAAVAATTGLVAAPAAAKTLDPLSPPGFALPRHATDCHVHIFDPVRFSYSQQRRYTPPPATVRDLQAFHAALGIERAVLVQPSVYGTNNACLLDALRQLGAAARGVAVVDARASAAELADLRGQGVRGVRINLEVARDRDPSAAIARFMATQEQVAEAGLFIQLYGALPVVAALAPELFKARVPVLIDHFGLAQAALGTGQDGFEVLHSLLVARKVYIKLSGPYQISHQAPLYGDIHPVARALAGAALDQAVWGSDWPHTGGANRPKDYRPADFELFRTEDDGHHLGMLRQWTSSAAQREQILAGNPQRLYDF